MGGRVDNVSRWKPDDLKKAREEWDPRLVAAITAYGPGKASSENAVKLLVELLQAPSTPSPTRDEPAPPTANALPAAPPPSAAPQLTVDAQGFTIIPNGVSVILTEPFPIPPEIAAQMQLPPQVKELPAGFTIPPGFKIPPGVQLPASAKITASAPPSGMNVPGMPPIQPASASPPTEKQVVEAIVLALGANKTDAARSALRNLLKGNMRTAISDDIVSGMAAKAMLIHATPVEEAGLVTVAANPGKLRVGVPPPGLQAALLDALDERATTKMRIDLVDAVLKSGSADQRKQVMAMLAKPRAENLPAQARLFKNDKLDAAVKKSLFEQFATYSNAAMDQLLQTKPAAGAAAPAAEPGAAPVSAPGPAKQLDLKTLQAVIEGVWGDDVVQRLKADGERSDDFEDFSSQLGLAIAMPVKDVRSTLLGLVRDSWVEGPSALAMGGRFGDSIRDPGALLVVKRSPRLEKPPEKPKKDDDKPDRPKRNRNPIQRRVDPKKEEERKKKKEKEDKAHYDWMSASEDFVHSLNERFNAAAQGGAGQRHKIVQETAATATAAAIRSTEPMATRFPLKLHEGARITAEYHFCLPEDLPEALQGVAAPPLIVHYVRMEDVSSFPKVNSNYLAQLKGVASHVRSGSRWLDWAGTGVAPGMTRSVDVMITRNGAAATPVEGTTAKADDAIPIITEVLVIEVPSFRAPKEDEE